MDYESHVIEELFACGVACFDNPLSVEETMAPKDEKPKLHWTNWATFIIAIVLFVGGILWVAHHEIVQINDRLGSIDKHISRVETAVRIVGAKQGGDTKTLIDEALTVAKLAADAGHTENAKAIVEMTNRLLAESKPQLLNEPPAFFKQTLAKYQDLKKSPPLQDIAQSGAVSLVEYRSSSEQPPSRGTFISGTLGQLGGFIYWKDGYARGSNAWQTWVGKNALDHMILDNVTLEDADIIYNGGPVVLRNVRFINCRFHVPNSPAGDQLLTAAVDQPVNVSIGEVPSSRG